METKILKGTKRLTIKKSAKAMPEHNPGSYLVNDVLLETFLYMSPEDIVSFGKTSKKNDKIFKDILQTLLNSKIMKYQKLYIEIYKAFHNVPSYGVSLICAKSQGHHETAKIIETLYNADASVKFVSSLDDIIKGPYVNKKPEDVIEIHLYERYDSIMIELLMGDSEGDSEGDREGNSEGKFLDEISVDVEKGSLRSKDFLLTVSTYLPNLKKLLVGSIIDGGGKHDYNFTRGSFPRLESLAIPYLNKGNAQVFIATHPTLKELQFRFSSSNLYDIVVPIPPNISHIAMMLSWENDDGEGFISKLKYILGDTKRVITILDVHMPLSLRETFIRFILQNGHTLSKFMGVNGEDFMSVYLPEEDL